MPEIPEMEHYKQLLVQTIKGKEMRKITVDRPKSINVEVEEFIGSLAGERIDEISRRAKLLIFHLRNGNYLMTHMMLDGRLYYGRTGETEGLPGKPDVTLDFADGNSLYFCDLRLGYLHLINRIGLETVLSELGVEPLSSEFTFDRFILTYKGRRGAIKPLLIDQKLVCGIGNAYSNDILFASKVLPDRKFPSLQDKELKTLWNSIPQILSKGIKNGGYIEEPYAKWDTTIGGQNNYFLVYDRGGQPCIVCGTTIMENKLNGRWTYWCPVCQK